MNTIWTNLRIFLWMTLLTGIIYPLFITGIAQLTMKNQADGNFISIDGKIVGATLIAQKFDGDKYFWSRPSAIDYNPLPSGGSNLGPTSAALKQIVEERREKLAKAHNVDKKEIPSELLFASGSGLDPHISVEAAYFQIDRISKARGLDSLTRKNEIKQLIYQATTKRHSGFFAEPCVNVLVLNISLDKLLHSP